MAALLVFVVLFWRLGVPTFWDPDEAHYAETSRELIASGDWWAPHYNGEPFFDKPVLFHQLQGAAMWALGPTEFAARIVPALAALGLILVTGWLGAVLVSADVGIVAAVLLAANPGVFALARYAILDTVFAFFTFGGAALVAVAALDGHRRRLQWVGYIAIALGALTKGPLAIALCGLAFAIAVAASPGARRRLLALRWMSGLALVLALSAPWLVYMLLRFGRAFLDGYLLDENIRLFAAERFGDQPGPWFYLQIVALGLLPWTGLLLGRLVDDARAVVRGERPDEFEILLWAWSAAVIGFFSLSAFKLDHYVFPAAPSLCLLLGRAWSDVRTDPNAARHAAARLGLQLVGPLTVALGLGFGYLVVARMALSRPVLVVPAALVLAGVMVTGRLNMGGGRLPRVPWLVVGATIVAYAGVILAAVPALERRKTVHQLATLVAHDARPGDRIASLQLDRWNATFRFYADRKVTFLDSLDEAQEFFATARPFYCIMRRAEYDQLVARGAPLRIVSERDGVWATSGRTLWRRPVKPVRLLVVARAR